MLATYHCRERHVGSSHGATRKRGAWRHLAAVAVPLSHVFQVSCGVVGHGLCLHAPATQPPAYRAPLPQLMGYKLRDPGRLVLLVFASPHVPVHLHKAQLLGNLNGAYEVGESLSHAGQDLPPRST